MTYEGFHMKSSSITSQWRSTNGVLILPGIILLKHHVRHRKNKSLLDKVEFLDANPQYAHVRLPCEKETIVSMKHLAPCEDTEISTKLLEAPNVISDNTDNIVEECES